MLLGDQVGEARSGRDWVISESSRLERSGGARMNVRMKRVMAAEKNIKRREPASMKDCSGFTTKGVHVDEELYKLML